MTLRLPLRPKNRALPRNLLRTLAVVVVTAGGAMSGSAAAAPNSLLADVVVIGVPGLRWSDVQNSPELTALVDQANVGSISVKTAGPRTCPVDGWLTISAGTRARVSDTDGSCPELPAVEGGRVAGWQGYLDRQHELRTDAELGRLGALGNRLCGFGPGAALAVARPDGTVAVNGGRLDGGPARWWPAFQPGMLAGCNDAVIDAGALPPREGRAEALKRVAGLVVQARAADRWVVLAGVAEELGGAHRELLVAMQVPPDNGARWLTSNTTRRPGLIQLTDLTATLLSDSAPDAPLDGAEIHGTGDRHPDAAAVIEDRLDTNERFAQPRKALVPVVLTLVVVQLLALGWYKRSGSRASRRTFAATLLTAGGFFSAVFLATVTSWWRWPSPGLALYGVTLVLSAAVGAVSYLLLRRRATIGVLASAFGVLLVDGVLGTPLQVGSMFADGPVIGGRFFGFGNSTFAVLALATLALAAAAGQRLLGSSRPYAAVAVLAIGLAGLAVDGKPGWGTDFGGVIALTPAVLLLAWYAWRGRITWKEVVGLGLTGFVLVALLAVLDYQRPPQDRTHFGTFVARLLDGDVADVLVRKLGLSLRFFGNPGGWAMLVAVIALVFACLAPQRVPSVSYRRFAESGPLVRPALLALVVCGVIGMFLNDVGVVLPSIMAGFAVPTLVAHLLVETKVVETKVAES